jgi:hypothetical protein
MSVLEIIYFYTACKFLSRVCLTKLYYGIREHNVIVMQD